MTQSVCLSLIGTKVCILAVFLGNSTLSAQVPAQILDLDGASSFALEEPEVNDIVYDSLRNVLYGTVGSSAGFPNGNSVARINPADGMTASFQTVGSEPNQLALSPDGSRLLIGIDGANAVRNFNLNTQALGPLLSLTVPLNATSIAESIVFSPTVPGLAVISGDEVASSASGDLVVLQDETFFPVANTFRSANSLAFTDSGVLLAFNNSSTGFDLTRYAFDPLNTTFVVDVTRSSFNGSPLSGFSTEIENAGPNILGNNGVLVDTDSLTSMGTFAANGFRTAFEIFPELGVAFALTRDFSSQASAELVLFDIDSFLEIDRFELDQTLTGDIEELIFAGDETLAFLTNDGEAGIINVPGLFVPIPEPSIALLLGLTAFPFLRRRRS